MSHEGTRVERESWKQRCEARFSERDFIRGKVEPLIPELADHGDGGGTATLARAKATGRMTLRYDFAESGAVYAKAYYGNGLGLRAYEWLRQLWEDGFGSQSRYRVAQPLGYIAEESMLVMREVRGAAISDLAAQGTCEQAVEAVRVAARWLLRFHQAHLDGLDVEPPCEQIEVLKTAALLAKVAAQFPARAPSLIDVVHRLRELAPSASSPVRLAPLHGQYRPAHVFIDRDAVSVIDLDKIRLSDPAKDVSRFVHVLKKTCYEAGGDAARADLLGREFVDEYGMGAPENLANLPYFDALYALKAFAKVVKSTKVKERSSEAIEQLYLDDFARATQPLASGTTAWIRDPLRKDVRRQAHREIESGQQPGAMPATDQQSKDALARKAVELTSEVFVRNRILHLAGASAGGRDTQFTASVVQNTGTGRLALLYDFGAHCGVVAKLYTDDLGRRSYAALQALWNQGFGPDSRYQVPEPLGFLADHNLLLMRRVPGVAISAALRGDRSLDLVESCREAARWLARLHGSALAIGHQETDWDSLKLFRMCARLLKAAAAKPEHLDTMRDLLDAVEERILGLHHHRRLVPTHGRYHSDHVLIGPQATSVIDLDRVGWSDPGKDIAEFVRVLRSTAFKNGDDMTRIDQATFAFLEEYLGQRPEAVKTLGGYWASFSLHSYLGALKKSRDKTRRTWQELLDFYCNEIHYALRYGI